MIDYENMHRLAQEYIVREAFKTLPQKPGAVIQHDLFITVKAPLAAFPEVVHQEYPDTITLNFNKGYGELEITNDELRVRLGFGGHWGPVVVPWGAIIYFEDRIADYKMALLPVRDVKRPEPGGAKPRAVEPEPASTVVKLDDFRKK